MPNQHITGIMSVKNGQKQQMLNISNAREIPYSQYSTMTSDQKNGVIVCPDYPVGESGGTLLNANQVAYDNGSTPSLTKGGSLRGESNSTDITSTNIQGAVAELDENKVSTSGGTMTGKLTVNNDVEISGDLYAPYAYLTTLNYHDDVTDKVLNITKPQLINTGGTQNFQDKGGTIALTSDIPTMANIINALYPIGAIYMTIGNTNPGTFLTGTTWEMLSDGYLRNNASAATGGSLTSGSTTLTSNQIPSHSHTATTQSAGNHTHTLTTESKGSHTHTSTTGSYGNHTHTLTSSSTTVDYSHSHTSTTGSYGNHTHTATTGSYGNHTHTATTQKTGAHQHTLQGGYCNATTYTGNYMNFPERNSGLANWDKAVTSNGDHTHTLTTQNTGAHTHTLTTQNTGAHTHTLTTNTVTLKSGHSHTATTQNTGAHTHTLTTDSQGAHTHTATTQNTGAHTHTLTTSNTGGGEGHTHSVEPTYTRIYAWQRTA